MHLFCDLAFTTASMSSTELTGLAPSFSWNQITSLVPPSHGSSLSYLHYLLLSSLSLFITLRRYVGTWKFCNGLRMSLHLAELNAFLISKVRRMQTSQILCGIFPARRATSTTSRIAPTVDLTLQNPFCDSDRPPT